MSCWKKSVNAERIGIYVQRTIKRNSTDIRKIKISIQCSMCVYILKERQSFLYEHFLGLLGICVHWHIVHEFGLYIANKQRVVICKYILDSMIIIQ